MIKEITKQGIKLSFPSGVVHTINEATILNHIAILKDEVTESQKLITSRETDLAAVKKIVKDN